MSKIKMSFDQLDNFHDALVYAFHPRGFAEDEDIDEKFLALWTIFLNMSGWTEEEFWDFHHDNHECDNCKKIKEELETKEKSEENKKFEIN